MANPCQPQDNRYRAKRQISMNMDEALWKAAKQYADRYNMTPTEFMESALARFIFDQLEPVPIQVCRTHGVVMEGNSSGTVTAACPVYEGASAVLYLGGEIPDPDL